MKQPRTLHYVLSTHWDREWYLPIQGFRRRLVRLFDLLLDRIGDGTLAGPFSGDGQAILIEDYLEIRPERETELRRRIEEGSLVFGPWYVLPDEFLVSGESLVRNLRFGRETVRTFGGRPSDAGFLCDMFGHNSQMPQILAGFGIKGALVWRGVDAQVGGRFLWQGADGTTLPAYRFGRNGYCDYTYKVRQSNQPAAVFDAERAERALSGVFAEELERTAPDGPALVFDGGDHLFPDFEHYALIRNRIEKSDGDVRVVHGTLDGFLDDLTATRGSISRTLAGELREPARWPVGEDSQYLIAGVGSSRVWIKQENAVCESLLCQWAEPFAALASLALGVEHPDRMLHVAWKWLLQNHPHDSICGCSIDTVHEDMRYRFSQCRQIAEVIASESLTALAAAAPGELEAREMRLALFNPLSCDRDEVFEFDVEIPVDWPEFGEFFGYESKPAFRLFDSAGREIAYQRLGMRRDRVRGRHRDTAYPQTRHVHAVRIAARLRLPALGFALLRVAGLAPAVSDVEPTRHPCAPGLRTGHARMENEHLAVEIHAGGQMTLTDKRSGHVYAGLNAFEDEADLGDGWNHGPAANRRDVLSGGGTAQIELLWDTPLTTAFAIRQTLALPEAFDTRTQARSDAREPMLVESRIVLRACAESVDVETRVVNAADDHRLRVLFPSSVAAETYLADTPFDVVERPVALRADNHLYREMETEMKPQQTWAAVFDGVRGLAVVTAGGQLESGVLDRPDRPLALTLFRATGRTVLTSGEPNGQLRGQALRFRYRLMPFAGEPDRTLLFKQAQDLGGGLRVVQFVADELAFQRSRLPKANLDVAGLMRIEGDVVLSSARQVGGALEVRLFNPTEHAQSARLVFEPGAPIGQIVEVDLESRMIAPAAPVAHGTLRLDLDRKQIKTVSCRPV